MKFNNFKKIGFNSIKSKVAIGMMCVSIVPISILGIGIYAKTDAMLEKSLSDNTQQITKEINNSINNYLNSFGNLVNSLSVNPVFENVSNLTEQNQIDTIKSTYESDETIESVYYATNSKMLVEPAMDVSNYDATTREWYKQAVEANGEMVIGSPYEDADTKKQVVTISKAVKKGNAIVGVIGLDITLTTLSNQISESKIGDNGYVFITEKDNTVAIHPEHSLVGKKLDSSINKIINSKSTGIIAYEFNGEDKYLTNTVNELTNWNIVSTISQDELKEDLNSVVFFILQVVIAIFVIASTFIYFFSRKLSKDIKVLNDTLKQASDGDLSVRANINSKDELKELEVSMNKMIGSISKVLTNVQASSDIMLENSRMLSDITDEVSSSSTQVATSIEEIAKGNASQSENTQESVYQINELSNEIDSIKTATDEVVNTTKNSTELSEKGLQKVDEMTEKFIQTKDSAKDMSETIQEVAKSINEITSIVDTIRGISDQTNLLSLNASIEAARAGEHGKGFAVVAHEIRSLADKSKQSTEEIKSIVDTITNGTTQVVNSMDYTMKNIEEQDVAVNESKAIFQEILVSIQEVAEKTNITKSSIDKVEETKNTLSYDMENISAISEQTASASQEVSASAEEISASMAEFNQFAQEFKELSEVLNNEVKQFKNL